MFDYVTILKQIMYKSFTLLHIMLVILPNDLP